MGQTFANLSPEEMCAAMCDNVVPKEKEQWWIFTFCDDQEHAGKYVRIWGTFGSARAKMFEKYDSHWGFQHSEEEWSQWLNEKPSYLPEETELETIK